MATGQQPEATAEAVIANPTENNRHAKSFSGNYDHYVADAATASLFRATHTQHTDKQKERVVGFQISHLPTVGAAPPNNCTPDDMEDGWIMEL